MFFFINKKSILQLVILVALLVWSVFTILTQMTLCPMDGQTVLCQSFFTFLAAHKFFTKAISILLLLLEILFVQRYFDVNKFADNQTYMPMVFFLLFTNLGHFWKTFSPVNLTLFIFVLLLLFFVKDDNDRGSRNYNRVFSAGILVGLATLLDPSAIWLLLFMIMVLLANQFSKFKELLILLIGFANVVIYLFAIGYLTDTLPVIGHSIKYLNTFTMLKNIKLLSITNWGFVGFLLLFVIYTAFTDKMFYDNKLVILRKRFTNTHFMMFVLLIMVVFSGLHYPTSLLYLSIPICLYLSVLCLNKKRKIFHDLLIIAFFVLLCL